VKINDMKKIDLFNTSKFIEKETNSYFKNIKKYKDFFDIIKDDLLKAFSNLENIEKLT
jgi:hypothetical protein